MKTENKTYKVIIDTLLDVEVIHVKTRQRALEIFLDSYGKCEMSILREINNDTCTHREMCRYTSDNN